MIKSDGAAVIALVEWDCPEKLRRIRQMTFYNADQSVIGTKKSGFDWSPIIPGSAGDFLNRRVCSAITLQTAEITAVRVDLRAFPGDTAPLAGVAKRGDKFQLVPESGTGGWFNLIDPATQEDYWLTGESFKTIDPAATAAAVAPPQAQAKRKKVGLSGQQPRRPGKPRQLKGRK